MASNVEAGNDVVDDDVDFRFLRRFVHRTARNGDFFEQNLFVKRSCSCWGKKVKFVRVKVTNTQISRYKRYKRVMRDWFDCINRMITLTPTVISFIQKVI